VQSLGLVLCTIARMLCLSCPRSTSPCCIAALRTWVLGRMVRPFHYACGPLLASTISLSVGVISNCNITPC
jgi:hypothetical protein